MNSPLNRPKCIVSNKTNVLLPSLNLSLQNISQYLILCPPPRPGPLPRNYILCFSSIKLYVGSAGEMGSNIKWIDCKTKSVFYTSKPRFTIIWKRENELFVRKLSPKGRRAGGWCKFIHPWTFCSINYRVRKPNKNELLCCTYYNGLQQKQRKNKVLYFAFFVSLFFTNYGVLQQKQIFVNPLPSWMKTCTVAGSELLGEQV